MNFNLLSIWFYYKETIEFSLCAIQTKGISRALFWIRFSKDYGFGLHLLFINIKE